MTDAERRFIAQVVIEVRPVPRQLPDIDPDAVELARGLVGPPPSLRLTFDEMGDLDRTGVQQLRDAVQRSLNAWQGF